MSKPLVGVTFSWYSNEPARVRSYGKWLYGLNQSYAELLSKADVIPIGIIPLSKNVRSILEVVDMVLMTGGGDPDPMLYGQINNGSINISRERPLWEMDLYRTARKMGVPVFSICLGMQLIAIAEGEELIQNIPTQVHNPVDHYGKPEDPRTHDVDILEGSILREILGEHIEVSSFHHQAISGIPAGFHTAAVSQDGVIEAIESDDGLVIAVQWHPERDFTGPIIMNSLLRRFCGDSSR
jgi:putative glutamine amidotransferase